MNTFDAMTFCPFCQYRAEAATDPLDRSQGPKDGDITLCIRCGEWSIFDAAAPGALRRPTFAEYEQIATDDDARRMRSAWCEFREQKAKPQLSPDERLAAILAPDLSIDQQFDLLCEHGFKTPPPDKVKPMLKRVFVIGALVFGERVLKAAKKNDEEGIREVHRLLDELMRATYAVLTRPKR